MREAPRPVLHFTAPINWLNDPNGLVYLNGEYHLFYQHDPDGIKHAGHNMHWGHAVSRDLLHWEHLPIAIHNRRTTNAPDQQAWSGSAVLDEQNLLKLHTPGSINPPPIAAFYTRTGVGQCLAVSLDSGRTWAEHSVVLPYNDDHARHRLDRDPRVFWHPSSHAYVMILYENDGYTFYRSIDLLHWTFASSLTGFYECPELVELAVPPIGFHDESKSQVAPKRPAHFSEEWKPINEPPAGVAHVHALEKPPVQTRWVLFDGDGAYVIGRFDGFRFEPQSPRLSLDLGPHFYATQCWVNTPDHRVIQIAWMRGGVFKDCDYSQQMSIPCELSLSRCKDGSLHLSRLPIRELPVTPISLMELEDQKAAPGELPPPGIEPGRFRIRFERATDWRIEVWGTPIEYWAGYSAITMAGRTARIERTTEIWVEIELVVDYCSLELFVDEGRTSISFSAPVQR